MVRRRLPPLNALSAFESVAEHGNLSAAALARGVAQPSISRHIALLEEWMAVSLVERQANAISLTADGVELSKSVRDAFDRIELAVRRLQERHAAPVVLGCSLAIAHLWLMPKLSSLRSAYPEADLSVFCSENHADFNSSDIDLSIRFGRGDNQPAGARLTIPECVFPVASPDFAGPARLTAASQPQDYSPADLLHHTRGTYGWLNWPSYFGALGFAFQAFDTISSYNNYPLLIDLARAGEGIVLGHAGPIDQFLQDGSLVQVGPAVQRPDHGFFLFPGEQLATRPATRQVHDRLLQQHALSPVENLAPD